MNDLDSWLLRSSRMLPPNGRANVWVVGAAVVGALVILYDVCKGWGLFQ